MIYATAADRAAFENEAPYDARDLPHTTWDMMSRTVALHGSRPALSFQLFSSPKDRGETLDWTSLQAKSAQTANLLRSLGVGETDVVALLLPNCTEVVLGYIGGQVAGIVNPINPLLEAEQIASILRETNAKVLITLRSFVKTDVGQKAAEALTMAPNVETVLEVDLVRYLTGIKRLVVPFMRPKNPLRHQARVLDFNREIAKQPQSLTFDPGHEDRVAAYFHTGGTTGMPRVAQQRYRGMVYNGWLASQVLFRETDVIMCPLPVFHVFAAIIAVGSIMASGAQLVLPTPAGYRGEGVFDNFWKLVARYKASFLFTVPTAMSALMQRPVDADISSMRLGMSGSAPLPHELYHRFEKATGVTICEGYGMTEATCLVGLNPPYGEKKIGSIGLAIPYTQVRIIDPFTQMDCPTDLVGEICISSPGVYAGHTYTEPEKNRDLFYPGPDGAPKWLRTGDLGRIDADGYIWITGRAKDLIIRGGHNIDPAMIEEALAGHPAVAFAGAIGQPDAHAGEVPCVYVELLEGQEASVAELMDYAKSRIPERAAHPKHLEILSELPKTAVGKIFKPDLRKRAIARVFNAAMANADVAAEVVTVVEDKRRGLVARIQRTGTVTEEQVARALGSFTNPWDWLS